MPKNVKETLKVTRRQMKVKCMSVHEWEEPTQSRTFSLTAFNSPCIHKYIQTTRIINSGSYWTKAIAIVENMTGFGPNLLIIQYYQEVSKGCVCTCEIYEHKSKIMSSQTLTLCLCIYLNRYNVVTFEIISIRRTTNSQNRREQLVLLKYVIDRTTHY